MRAGAWMLAARLGQEPAGIHISWVQGSSMAALEALGRGEVHVAGLHLCDEATHEFNLPFVRRALPGRAMLFVNFASGNRESSFALATR